MNIEKKELSKSQVELTIEVSVEEMKPFLEKAAQSLSESKNIPGFRPGKATVDAVKQHVGEMPLWQEAGEAALWHHLKHAVKTENLQTVGQPQIAVEKLAPNNPFVFKATFSLLPEVTLPDVSTLKVEREKFEITEKQVDEALEEVRNMRRSEALVDRESKEGDKLEISLKVTLEDKTVDDQNHLDVIIGEKKYIKGFEEALVGLKKDDEKSFDLTFPKDYYNKDLANKEANFAVKVLTVYELTLPEVNDEFAQSVGSVKTVESLKNQLRSNLEIESKRQIEQKLENDLVEQLVKNTTFGEIPESLINSEVQAMMREFAQRMEQQGSNIEDYLKHVGKTEAEFMLEFTPQATERVKSALALRTFVKQEGLEISREELDKKIGMMKEMYQHNPEAQKQMDSPEYREYLNSTLLSRNALDTLKEKAGVKGNEQGIMSNEQEKEDR